MRCHLEWSVKLSLLMYVTSAPGGRLEVDGVTSERGTFRFPLEEVGADGSLRFGGSVAFFAHHGAFITTLSHLQLTPGALGWAVSYTPPGADGPIVAWRTGAPAPEAAGVTELPVVALTEGGAAAFGGYYAAGEAFDPMRVVGAPPL
ncbi:HtaA domain-containing protein [Microbacterium fluvii]|uniref:HtaA domain-containing protein n=1 Tax=Microbacterium fluvii TaxID=415215 RepID=A0ABW2HKH6_9MICO|nr:HtaA domain-containing protein [Microbacterium fluvii]MCU4673980.1 HtaA domain-containing protein [Microbacterium fluvii]